MNVVKTIDEVRALLAQAKLAGKTVGLVPTMGKLHEGHFSLVDAARRDCDFVVVSIFVNPTQFGADEDLVAYPSSPAEDIAGCRARGVDAVFMPSVEQMYPRHIRSTIRVAGLGEVLCGASRPGHFDGVCTVVAKLFNIVQPDWAFFGAKDYQQTVVIRRMSKDLDFPVKIVVCPTVRESAGLAMSSRNEYLNPAQRKQAAALSVALDEAARSIRDSHPPAEQVVAAIRKRLAAEAPDGRIDYVSVVDPEDLSGLQTTDRPVLVALAVHLGGARLIDNVLVD